VLTGDGGGGRAGRGGAREVLTGDRGVAPRRRTGGSERWRLELVAGAKEGCGVSSPFYRGWGSAGEGWPGGVTAVLMALTPLKRLRGGNDGGASNGSGGIRG
jgi:hypothetical protein